MKPLPLMERAISNSSKAGELVLDPFLGSGSTLIASALVEERMEALDLRGFRLSLLWDARGG